MVHVGTASGEGGPFLLADARAVRAWHGGASNDYEDLCKALDAAGPTWGLSWLLGANEATVWEPEGPGTVDVFASSEQSLLLVRGLGFEGDWDAATRLAAGAPAVDAGLIGHVDVPSGVLAVLWSPENGACVTDEDLIQGKSRPTGGLAIDGSSLLTRLPQGPYACFADLVRIPQGKALRCFIVPRGKDRSSKVEASV
jgi:hypothetical protein